jgi:hypothetical protein
MVFQLTAMDRERWLSVIAMMREDHKAILNQIVSLANTQTNLSREHSDRTLATATKLAQVFGAGQGTQGLANDKLVDQLYNALDRITKRSAQLEQELDDNRKRLSTRAEVDLQKEKNDLWLTGLEIVLEKFPGLATAIGGPIQKLIEDSPTAKAQVAKLLAAKVAG